MTDDEIATCARLLAQLPDEVQAQVVAACTPGVMIPASEASVLQIVRDILVERDAKDIVLTLQVEWRDEGPSWCADANYQLPIIRGRSNVTTEGASPTVAVVALLVDVVAAGLPTPAASPSPVDANR